ncbi:hypothetical protein IU500_33950 [Nocardia terpenica]|uniref:hypothetical protein n=1 Tax=Nocardia terpenica TaxID=455432 RepID=UPI0018935BFE|nr:hypothetical protein [Nocardia terpenica]MBF6066053.1 hypothetical protein [Nocardia terpenica]MBF6109020.1 hypothetical protein [Nocardia terpenica]MBF6116297.1 hypothetical protein [Nocardia terpenica]MBF6123298.1 hypothetical protein [Nocardia terpenica]MBF6156519.1 hypothetical protein [Nocardia terpenica]
MFAVAGRESLDLVKIFEPTPSVDDAVKRLKIMTARRGATTVIVPSLRHLHGREAEITTHYTLIEATPDGGGAPVVHRRLCAEIVT